ncbi:MAG: DNA/RNA nuclease SfsA [Alphaproteobacteria bacterium]|nr:DNA/RNA nuclease SfsA [Alphaproteobacteria bacterium]
MKFEAPLIKAQLLDRQAKVLIHALIPQTNSIVPAYCSNMSRLESVYEQGMDIYLSKINKENSKLKLTWEIALSSGTMVGVNFDREKYLVNEAILKGFLPELSQYQNVEMSDQYFDLVLNNGDEECFVVISSVYCKKNVSLIYPTCVDVVNHHMMNRIKQKIEDNKKVFLILLAQRMDFLNVVLSLQSDAEYINDIKENLSKGLEIICLGCNVSEEEITVSARMPFLFK